MRAGAELEIFLRIFGPLRDRDEGRNAEITRDVEHPELASGLAQLVLQVADVGIVDAAEIERRPAQPVVPPDRVRVALHELQKALDDGLLEGVARRAAVGIGRGLLMSRAPAEIVQEA